MSGMIEAHDLAHEYFRRDAEGNVIGEKRALDGINLQIQQGAFIAVLGANGSGKSTFAKHLNALLRPTEGTLLIRGMDSSDFENELEIRQTAGMVFQNPDNQIIANIVEEDVGFGPENMGIPTEKIWKRVDESLKSVGMYEYRKHSPNKLSGGQKQRVAIAGIMAMRPQCIILDEPTAMLDPTGRHAVIETITQINKEEEITIILITHNMEEVVGADYVYAMNEGRIWLEGTPRQVFAQTEELEECRLTIPEVTRIALLLRRQGIMVPIDVLSQEELVAAVLQEKAKFTKNL